VPWAKSPLYAPDCICHNGRYYLCFCLANASEGIAVSDQPQGPFRDAFPVAGADGDAIDPAILRDDDGQLYFYWGQFHCRGARLTPDLQRVDAATLKADLLTERDHGFHEGVSVRKRNGLYYLVYTDISRGRATCLAYATSTSPLGPFEKRGILIDNTGCDRETWNNHGSIAEFNGTWYVFYHRSSQASKFSRRVCAEPIRFGPDGSLPEVEMTTQGVTGPIPATTPLEACRACLLSGQVRTAATGAVGEGAAAGAWSEHLTWIHDGDWAAYKYLDFGAGVTSFHAEVASLSYGGRIEVRCDRADGPLVGTCEVPRTGGWEAWTSVRCSVRGAEGVRALYLVFHGLHGRLLSLRRFHFGTASGD